MKKLLVLAILVSCFIHQPMNAQVSLSVNIGVQPIWGPVGYDHAEYYYMPDVEAYYYVPKHRFIYFEGNTWVSRPSLPPRYRDYDLYKIHKVVINEPRPYLRHHEYRERYSEYRGRHEQVIIRDCHEPRYCENRNHPEHYRWKEERRQERGHGRRYRDQDRGHQDHQENGDHRR